MKSQTKIIKFILLNIYLEKWKPQDGIFSSEQIAIKFNTSISTSKKTLKHLKDTNILDSHHRVGYSIKKDIYKLIPLSLRNKYDIKPLSASIEKNGDYLNLKKEYSIDNKTPYVWVDTIMDKSCLAKHEYSKGKTFMWNLAKNGIVIFRISSSYKIETIDNKHYVVERRKLFNENDIKKATETIYTPIKIWYESKDIKL